MIAEIAVGLAVDKTFHYRIPDALTGSVSVGKRVWVPFGFKRVVGYVVSIADLSDVPHLKDIEQVIDEVAVLDDGMIRLTKWMSEQYFCSWGEAIENALPGTLRRGRTKLRPHKTDPERVYDASVDLQLTLQQKAALDPVLEDMNAGRTGTYLLFGITGSGKTELYLQAISCALKQNKSSIVLVPEIALTPQATERYKSRFGEAVSVIHSRLAEGVRLREWERAREGTRRIIIGPRSALFSPVKDLGLIVIDEEHETSYKQEDSPRYHARDLALERARLAHAVVVLGSATPSLESYYQAQRGVYRLITLTERIEQRELPPARIVDMRKEIGNQKRIPIFSYALQDALRKTLEAKHQAILFLNRRGFSTHIDCKVCGAVIECKRCKAVLVYHADADKLVCHYCNRRSDAPKACPSCQSPAIKFFGLGTQKVESEAHKLFPGTRIARMDTDATSKRGSHDKIFDEFKEGKIDILIGTQMIAKGLDFPAVTLVGVISADTSLNLPDFRASERTFGLLTQVAGRAGRGDLAARAIIQTYAPTHYAIKAASEHDYTGFYETEIKVRRRAGFPPYYRLIKCTFRAAKEENAIVAAEAFAKKVKELKFFKVTGPAPSPLIKVRGQYRWNVFLKFRSAADIPAALRGIIAGSRKGRGVFMFADVDPISMS
ncbi:MAG: primosomal protein N' [Candidatus Omnitrophota bacterium]